MENIELFNHYTAKILSSLYKAFPVPLLLEHDDLADEFLGQDAWKPDVLAAVVAESDVGDQDEGPKDRTPEFRTHSTFAWYTIRWLHNRDYIQTTDPIDLGRREAARYVLSPKAFEILSGPPASLEAGGSLGEQLADAAKQTAVEAKRTTVTEIVRHVVGLALRLGDGAMGIG